MPDTEIKLNPLTIARHLKDKKMKITIRASLRICPIFHWHVKIYASTPENLTPLIISRKLFAKSVTIFYIIPQQQFHKHEGSDLVGFILLI